MTAEPRADELGDDDDVAAASSGLPVAGPQQFSLFVAPHAVGQRLDAFLAREIAGVSRARIRRAIDDSAALVDGARQRASYRVALGERIEVQIAAALETPQPEPIPLDVLYEDDSLAVINKPPGMVVHPAKGHWAGTLVGALAHRYSTLSGVGGPVRPGIVHRLDRDTSGAIVIAKSDAAHEALALQFHDRKVQKEYLAIVAGRPDRDADRVTESIGPHPTHREKMALRSDHPESRTAETFFEVVERFPGFALMRAFPKTGRTHQVRLHLAHLRCPVLCDKQYGGRSRLTYGELRAITRCKRLAPDAPADAVLLNRQALHAHRLSLAHPHSGAPLVVEAPLPADMQQVLIALRETREA